MPKVGYSSKDQQVVELGMQEGNVEVVNAVVLNHQFPPNKKTGEQEPITPKVRLTVKKLDKDLEPTSDETEELYWKLGAMDKFHPGLAVDSNDEDPRDQGDELEAEGNCIYPVEETHKVNNKSRWSMMATSLEEKGFRVDVLGKGYLPDLVGLKMHVFTKTLPKDFWGSDRTGQKDPNAMLCDKIYEFPYEKGSGKPKGKSAPAKSNAKPAASSANGKPNGKAATAPATQPADAPGNAEIAVTVLRAVVDEMKGKEDVERKKLQTAVQMKLMNGEYKQPAKVHKEILDNLRSDEWLIEQAMEMGFTFSTNDDGVISTVSFAD